MRRENANSSTDTDDPEGDSEESFLGRWSRRKQQARSGQEVPPAATPAEEKFAPESEEPPERVLTDEDMPPLDSLDADSDYSGFLSPGVSEALRNAALKKMFMSPKFNVLDGLDDYAEDFTKFAPLGDIITADMRHQMEVAEERAKKALEEELAASDGEPAETLSTEGDAGTGDEQETRSVSAQNETGAENEDPGRPESDGPSNDEPRSS